MGPPRARRCPPGLCPRADAAGQVRF
jgi:hypothetical protein